MGRGDEQGIRAGIGPNRI